MSAPGLVLKAGAARCVLCRREEQFTDKAPRDCRVRQGGCGAARSMTVLRMPRRDRVTAGYAAQATIPQMMAAAEEARRVALAAEEA